MCAKLKGEILLNTFVDASRAVACFQQVLSNGSHHEPLNRKEKSMKVHVLLPDAHGPFLFLFLIFEVPLMKRVIQRVSGHIGSGKSRYTLQWYYHLVWQNGGKPVPATIATPTNGLSKQYRTYLEKAGIPCLVISRDEGFRSASEEYRRQCDEGFEGILIVNHSVVLASATDTSKRLLIIDEAFTPFENIRIEFESAEELKDFCVIDSDRSDFYELVPSDRTLTALIDILDKNEARYRKFGKLAQDLAEYTMNHHYQVIIDKATFDDALSGKSFEKSTRVALQFTIFLLPSILDGYEDVLIISANFEKTFVAMMWSKDVVFLPNDFIESRLDYSDLSHKADCVKIYHPPIKNLSKFFLTKLGKKDYLAGCQTFYDMCAEAIHGLFEGREHIFCTNKHPHENKKFAWALEGELGGNREITNPHGRNDLQATNMGVFLAAINLDPDTEGRLKAFYGISAKQTKDALCYQMVYQFLGRTSLRSFESREKVVLVVPDAGAAAAVEEMLQCEPSTPLPIDFGAQPKRGRPRVKRSVAEEREMNRLKVQRHRAKKAAKAAAQLSV